LWVDLHISWAASGAYEGGFHVPIVASVLPGGLCPWCPHICCAAAHEALWGQICTQVHDHTQTYARAHTHAHTRTSTYTPQPWDCMGCDSCCSALLLLPIACVCASALILVSSLPKVVPVCVRACARPRLEDVATVMWALTVFRHYDPSFTQHVARALAPLLQRCHHARQQQQQQLACAEGRSSQLSPSDPVPTQLPGSLLEPGAQNAARGGSSSSSPVQEHSRTHPPLSPAAPPPLLSADPEHLVSLLHALTACTSYQPGLYHVAGRLLVDQLDALDVEQLVQVGLPADGCARKRIHARMGTLAHTHTHARTCTPMHACKGTHRMAAARVPLFQGARQMHALVELWDVRQMHGWRIDRPASHSLAWDHKRAKTKRPLAHMALHTCVYTCVYTHAGPYARVHGAQVIWVYAVTLPACITTARFLESRVSQSRTEYGSSSSSSRSSNALLQSSSRSTPGRRDQWALRRDTQAAPAAAAAGAQETADVPPLAAEGQPGRGSGMDGLALLSSHADLLRGAQVGAATACARAQSPWNVQLLRVCPHSTKHLRAAAFLPQSPLSAAASQRDCDWRNQSGCTDKHLSPGLLLLLLPLQNSKPSGTKVRLLLGPLLPWPTL